MDILYKQAKGAKSQKALQKLPQQDAYQTFISRCGNIYIPWDHLKILKLLNEDDLEVVYEALWYYRDEYITVKLTQVKEGVITSLEHTSELIGNALLLSTLNHRSIVKFYGMGCQKHECLQSINSSLYLVFECNLALNLYTYLVDRSIFQQHTRKRQIKRACKPQKTPPNQSKSQILNDFEDNTVKGRCRAQSRMLDNIPASSIISQMQFQVFEDQQKQTISNQIQSIQDTQLSRELCTSQLGENDSQHRSSIYEKVDEVEKLQDVFNQVYNQLVEIAVYLQRFQQLDHLTEMNSLNVLVEEGQEDGYKVQFQPLSLFQRRQGFNTFRNIMKQIDKDLYYDVDNSFSNIPQSLDQNIQLKPDIPNSQEEIDLADSFNINFSKVASDDFDFMSKSIVQESSDSMLSAMEVLGSTPKMEMQGLLVNKPPPNGPNNAVALEGSINQDGSSINSQKQPSLMRIQESQLLGGTFDDNSFKNDFRDSNELQRVHRGNSFNFKEGIFDVSNESSSHNDSLYNCESKNLCLNFSNSTNPLSTRKLGQINQFNSIENSKQGAIDLLQGQDKKFSQMSLIDPQYMGNNYNLNQPDEKQRRRNSSIYNQRLQNNTQGLQRKRQSFKDLKILSVEVKDIQGSPQQNLTLNQNIRNNNSYVCGPFYVSYNHAEIESLQAGETQAHTDTTPAPNIEKVRPKNGDSMFDEYFKQRSFSVEFQKNRDAQDFHSSLQDCKPQSKSFTDPRGVDRCLIEDKKTRGNSCALSLIQQYSQEQSQINNSSKSLNKDIRSQTASQVSSTNSQQRVHLSNPTVYSNANKKVKSGNVRSEDICQFKPAKSQVLQQGILQTFLKDDQEQNINTTNQHYMQAPNDDQEFSNWNRKLVSCKYSNMCDKNGNKGLGDKTDIKCGSNGRYKGIHSMDLPLQDTQQDQIDIISVKGQQEYQNLTTASLGQQNEQQQNNKGGRDLKLEPKPSNEESNASFGNNNYRSTEQKTEDVGDDLQSFQFQNLKANGSQLKISEEIKLQAIQSCYLAPEILQGQPPTDKGKIYAIGIMMYELFTGDLFYNNMLKDSLVKNENQIEHLSHQLENISRNGLSEQYLQNVKIKEYKTLIRQCTQIDKNQRVLPQQILQDSNCI